MEYVIWGIPAGSTDETVLYTKAKSRKQAENVKAVLESKHGCRSVRIQEIDMGHNNVADLFRRAVR